VVTSRRAARQTGGGSLRPAGCNNFKINYDKQTHKESGCGKEIRELPLPQPVAFTVKGAVVRTRSLLKIAARARTRDEIRIGSWLLVTGNWKLGSLAQIEGQQEIQVANCWVAHAENQLHDKR